MISHERRGVRASGGISGLGTEKPWGDGEWILDLAGGPYHWTGLGEGHRRVLETLYGNRHIARRDPPAMEIRAHQSPVDEDRSVPRFSFQLTYAEDAVWLEGRSLLARFDWRPALGAVLWTPVAHGPELESVFENVLRALLAYRMLELEGVLLHSAAVVGDGGARIFFGPSGAGKSTLAWRALDAGALVLSDDLNAIRWRRGEPVVEAVPFTGELRRHAAAGTYPLRSVARLRHGAEVRATARSSAVTLAGLVACSPYVNGDPYRRTTLTRHLGRLLTMSPGYELEFPRRAELARILAALEEAGE